MEKRLTLNMVSMSIDNEPEREIPGFLHQMRPGALEAEAEAGFAALSQRAVDPVAVREQNCCALNFGQSYCAKEGQTGSPLTGMVSSSFASSCSPRSS